MKNQIVLFFVLLGLASVYGCGKGGESPITEVQSLYVSPVSTELALNSTYQFYCIAVDKGGNPHKVKAAWRTYYSTVGSIDAEGKFSSGIEAGSDYIEAAYGGERAYALVTVKPGALVSISIDPPSATLEVGDSISLTATGKDSYGNDVSVSPVWSVEGGIGSISEDYYIYYYSADSTKGIKCSSAYNSNYAYFTASAGGDGLIKARYGSFEATAAVKVRPPAPYKYSTHWLTRVGAVSAVPRCVTIGPDGNLWVGMYVYSYSSSSGGTYEGSVYKYDPAGTLLFSLEAAVSGEGRLQIPNDIAFDSSGNIYVTDYQANRVCKYDDSGNFLLAWGGSGAGTGQFSWPARIAIDGDNNVYVTDYGNNRVEKFNSSGGFVRAFGSLGTGAGQFNGPAGIVIDTGGNIYVADKGNNRIQKFSGSGDWLAALGSYGSGAGELSEPIGLAFDSDGNLFVADTGNYRISAFDSSGNYLYKFGSYGSGTGSFYGLIDLAIDPLKNIYTAEMYNARVQKFVR